MGGTSDQEKFAQQQIQQQKRFQGQLNSGRYNANNPFLDYKAPFNYQDISGNIDKIFGNTRDTINRTTENVIANQQRKATESLASRGITGGSIINSTTGAIAEQLAKSKTDALSNLGVQELGAKNNLMQYINSLDMQGKSLGTQYDIANKRNVLNSLSRSYGTQAQFGKYLDNTNGWDDAMAAIKLAAEVAGAIAMLG